MPCFLCGELSFTFLSSQWKCAESESYFRHLASIVPQVVSDTEISAALEQWKLLAIDNTPNEWDNSSSAPGNADCNKPLSINVCWSKVLDRKNALGEKKYPILGKIVKA